MGGADILMVRGLLKGTSETHDIVLRDEGREPARDLLVEHTYSLSRPPRSHCSGTSSKCVHVRCTN